MLTTYFRIKYPHIVDAALAASAPILFTGSDVDYTFFQAITDDFYNADSTCPGLVRQAFDQLLQLAAQGQSGLDFLTRQFSLCSPLKTTQDAEHLLLWVVNAFTSIAMCDYPYPTGFLAPLPAWPVNVACKIMTGKQDMDATLLSRLAQAAGLFYNGTSGTLTCFNITDEFVECADQTGCGTGPAGWAWDYQACSELNYLPSTNNVTDMFPPRLWDSDKLSKYCASAWGIQTRPDWLTLEYGLTPALLKKSPSRIIFSNGLLDPWHVGGVLESLSDSLVAVIIKDGAHHLDLRASNKDDPQSVITARKQEVALLHQWIDEISSERQFS
jgi:dipeptidyl-peptidase-2